MGVADNPLQTHGVCYMPRHRWHGSGATYNNIERCYTMITDTLPIKLERIHVLADILTTLLVGNPQAQVLAEIIMETSLLTVPED